MNNDITNLSNNSKINFLCNLLLYLCKYVSKKNRYINAKKEEVSSINKAVIKKEFTKITYTKISR